MKYIETIKSIALVILFTLSVTLASIYIVNTQRLTMAGESPLDLDSLLFLRGEGGEVTELNVSYFMPETVCYAVDGDMRCIYADVLTAGEVYISTREVLVDILSSIDSATLASDADATLRGCMGSRNFVYYKYHTPLPSELLLTSVSGATLSSQTASFGGDLRSISEVFILLEDAASGRPSYSAVLVCGDGSVLTLAPRSAGGDESSRYFGLDTLTSYSSSYSAVKCDFAANADTSGFGGLKLKSTAIVTDNVISAPLVAIDEPISGGQSLSESMLRCFEFNPDRINTYNESNSVSVYVEGNMTLRVEKQLIRYTASGDDGIEAARLLGYESYSGNYSVIELVGAAGSFIDSVRLASGFSIGGEAQPTLTAIESDGTRVRLEFSLTHGGAMLYTDAFEPIVGYELTFEDGRLKSADICTTSFTSGIGSVASYTQRWTLDKLATRLSPAVRDAVGRIDAGYVVTSLVGNGGDPEVTTAALEWVFVYGDEKQ